LHQIWLYFYAFLGFNDKNRLIWGGLEQELRP